MQGARALDQNIFLIGYRACGKSAVGRVLARRLNRPFVDADLLLVQTDGRSIAEIVAAGGWDDFRAKETSVLRDICKENGQVVATGGGVILREENRKLLHAHGICIWLTADVATMAERLSAGAGQNDLRPSLTGRPVIEEIETVLAERLPLYQATADISIATDGRSITAIERLIRAELDQHTEF